MLSLLRIKNLAIVENVRVEFQAGLNVITGETGAGKSVIVGALSLVLGERADKTLIRAGEEQCGVEAVFELGDPQRLNALLAELGLEPCEDGRVIIRRLVCASGAGKSLINDSPATLQALKQVGDLLVDMHGPHDHQSLLSPDFQLELLDAYGDLGAARAAYAAEYQALSDCERRRRELDGNDEHVEEQIELLTYQVKEIEDAGFADGDDEELPREHAEVANAARILALADAACSALSESETCAFQGLAAAQNALQEMANLFPEAGEWRAEAASIAVQIQELARSVGDRAQRVSADPERLQWLEDRMALLHKLRRKYGATVAEMGQFAERARERLARLESRGEAIARLDAERAAVRERMTRAGEELGARRRTVARALAKGITRELKDLGFAHGSFDVALESGPPRPSGLDAAEFGFAPNAGEPMRPLRAIASSGEISRVMLAVKTVLATHDRIPVLVFDEIDSNVGGEMGNAIGQKLSRLAGHRQVLCITHLPQVAVHGTTHFVVTKDVRDGRTRTGIQAVEREARVEEVGRMLGGRDLTSVTLRHAREMLKQG